MSQALRLYRTLDIHRTEYSSHNEDDRNYIERIVSLRAHDS